MEIAIIENTQSALRAARELNYLGIKAANIELLIGKEDAAKLDTATGQHRFPAEALRIGLETAGRDRLDSYRSALLRDHAVIAVVIHDHDLREKVHTLLKTYGAYAITTFDQLLAQANGAELRQV